MTKIRCNQCNIEIERKGANNKFCSLECRYKARYIRNKNLQLPKCFECNHVHNRKSIFCSPKCFDMARIRQTQEAKCLEVEAENLCRMYEILHTKKELIVMKESIGFTKIFGNTHKNIDI